MFAGSVLSANAVSFDKVNSKITETSDYFLSLSTPTVNSIGGEWMIIGLARNNTISQKFADGYYKNVVSYVSNIGSSKLHRAKSTDNSRVIIALTSIGKDVTNIAGYNLLEPLADFNYVVYQGINGPIWTLIALDTIQYEIPVDNSVDVQTTREKLIEYIISKQLENGGWTLSGSNPDPDMTGMAIQSLAPYYNKDNNVKSAIDKALNVLSEIQQDSGGFSSWGTDNSESVAQVITALTSLGINPQNDNRFIKQGNSPVDALITFETSNGFLHIKDSSYNQMATEQAFYALVSYSRIERNLTSLYDMSDLLMPMDVNDDETVSIDDATLIQKYLADSVTLTARQIKIADCNHDGIISIDDVTALQKAIAEIN